jgi:polyhydroxybutyrate depolymerase
LHVAHACSVARTPAPEAQRRRRAAIYTRGVRALGALLATSAALLLAACGSGSQPPAARTTTTARPAVPARPVSGGCAAAAPASQRKVAGAPLDTILRVPAKVRGKRAPLVLALHFASGSGAQMEQVTRLTPEARRSGFVVAYPSATSGGVWAGADEIGAVTRTLQAIERAACIDPRRIYLTGISNGGGMANLLACRFPDRFAGVVEFAPAVSGIGDCSPPRPISMLEIHGTADPLVPYAAIPGFVAAWARLDGCAAGPRSARAGTGATRQRWTGCRGGAAVEHLRLAGGKHIELLPELRSAGIEPARTAWRFLASHRLPS